MNKKPIVNKEIHAVLPVDLDLFKILSLTKHKRLSKTEAFFWLINKILSAEAESESESLNLSFIEDKTLNGHAILTSYRELAKQWGWSRDTVSSFLSKLKESYIISVVQTPKGVYITGGLLYFSSYYLTKEEHTQKKEDPPQPELSDSESSEENFILPEYDETLLHEETNDAQPFA